RGAAAVAVDRFDEPAAVARVHCEAALEHTHHGLRARHVAVGYSGDLACTEVLRDRQRYAARARTGPRAATGDRDRQGDRNRCDCGPSGHLAILNTIVSCAFSLMWHIPVLAGLPLTTISQKALPFGLTPRIDVTK